MSCSRSSGRRTTGLRQRSRRSSWLAGRRGPTVLRFVCGSACIRASRRSWAAPISGVDVNRAVRDRAAGHGGENPCRRRGRAPPGEGVELRDLGAFALAGLPGPERIFRLVVPGLRSDFPPLRVEAADKRRLPQRLPKRRSRKPTFEEAAWQVRAMLPGAAPVLQESLGGLAGELFVAHRALAGADGFLARIDRKRLAARLAAQREVTLCFAAGPTRGRLAGSEDRMRRSVARPPTSAR